MLPLIVNVIIYTSTIDIVSLYTSACYSSIEIIFKITIIKISCIDFTFVLIGIAINNDIYDARGNKFVFPYFGQTVINLNIII